MVEVRPDEVSAILRQQLSGFKSEAELEEVGTVLQVGDGIARVYGLTKVQSGELVEFDNGLQGCINLGSEGEINEMHTNDIISLAANVPHDLFAKENTIIRLTLFKSDTVERVLNVIK